ncbi:hypothetical protein ACP4OV_010493 [Aristida adscensionis]
MGRKQKTTSGSVNVENDDVLGLNKTPLFKGNKGAKKFHTDILNSGPKSATADSSKRTAELGSLNGSLKRSKSKLVSGLPEQFYQGVVESYDLSKKKHTKQKKDHAAPKPKTQYVRNVNPNVTGSLLIEVFQSAGLVESCKLIQKEKFVLMLQHFLSHGYLAHNCPEYHQSRSHSQHWAIQNIRKVLGISNMTVAIFDLMILSAHVKWFVPLGDQRDESIAYATCFCFKPGFMKRIMFYLFGTGWKLIYICRSEKQLL